jgi:hypothetical protein
MDEPRYRLNTLRQQQIDLHYVLENTLIAQDARSILAAMLLRIENEIAEIECSLRHA